MIARALSLAAIAFLSLTSRARAHDAIVEAGPFVNGLLHPVLEPAHLLSLLAIGLWLGQQDRDALRRAVLAFAVALISGLMGGPIVTLPTAGPLALAVALGCLAAAGWTWPPRAAAMLAILCAIVIGLDSGAEDWALATGIWVGAMLIALNVVSLSMRIEAGWLRIAIRIAGAWIAAIALMLLALSLRA